MSDTARDRRRRTGKKSANQGKTAEIDALNLLRHAGYLVFFIPTPYAIVREMGGGTFIGRRKGSAGVDIMGTCPNGLSLLVEVKSHQGRLGISDSGLKHHQASVLQRAEKKGGVALICWNGVFATISAFIAKLTLTNRKSMAYDEFCEIQYLI